MPLPGMLEMLVNVVNVHVDVLVYFVGARRRKLDTLAAQHNGSLADVELRMSDTATRTRGA